MKQQTIKFLKYGSDGIRRTLIVGNGFAFGSCLAKDLRPTITIVPVLPTASEILEDCDK